MKLYFLLIFAFIFMPVFAQETNLDLIKELSKKASVELLENADKYDAKSISIQIDEHPAAWLYEQMIVNNAASKKINILDSGGAVIKISIVKLDVKYSYYSSKDSLIRNIEIELFAKLNQNNNVNGISPKKYQYQDTINYDNIQDIQSDVYDFANGKIPKKKETFFKKYMEPILITTAAALTVFLFFTVRSG